MEEKKIRELNQDEMDKISGGTNGIEVTNSSPDPGSTSGREQDPKDPNPGRRRYD